MGKLEAIARMNVREGKLEGFKKQAAEIIRLVKEKDTKTLRYDWFLNSDQTECEVHEAYESSEGLIEHVMHIQEARDKLFSEFAYGHAITIYGEPSPQLKTMAHQTKDLDLKWFSFLKGLGSLSQIEARPS